MTPDICLKAFAHVHRLCQYFGTRTPHEHVATAILW